MFRAYHIPYNVYGGNTSFYAGTYEALIAGVRDEASEYLDKKVTEVKKLGVAKVSCVTKEGSAADQIIAQELKTPGGLIAMCSQGALGPNAGCSAV